MYRYNSGAICTFQTWVSDGVNNTSFIEMLTLYSFFSF